MQRMVWMDDLCFDTEIVDMLGAEGIMLYQRLWSIAEDWGGYEPKYKDIALKMGAFKFSAKKVETFIKKMVQNKKIVEYQAGGKTIHWLVNFSLWQTLNNPRLNELPLPPWIESEIKTKTKGKYKKIKVIYRVLEDKVPVPFRPVHGQSTADPRPVHDQSTDRLGNGKEEVEVELEVKGNKKKNVEVEEKPEGKPGKDEVLGPEPGKESEGKTETAPVMKTEGETETTEVVPGWEPVALEAVKALCKKHGVTLTQYQLNIMAPWTAEARMSAINDLIAAHNKKTKPRPAAEESG